MNALRAELVKATTTRLLLWYAVGLLGFLVLALSIHIATDDPGNLAELSAQRSIFEVAGLVAVVAVLIGAVLMTGEYAHGTINQSFLAVPARERLLAAKLGAVLLVVLALAVLTDVATLVIVELWFRGRGVTLHVGSGTIAPLLGALGASLLAGAIGLGLGALLRRQTGVIVAILLWLLIGEAVINAAGSVARYSPGHVLGAVVGAHAAGSHDSLAVWAAVAAGLVYAAVFCAAGLLATLGSDVPTSGD
jgi:ABC-type transport system involved in multi-copper enzyme maturation permease subunit